MRLIDWWFLSKLFNKQNESKNDSILSLLWQAIMIVIGIIIALLVAYWCVMFIVFIVKL